MSSGQAHMKSAANTLANQERSSRHDQHGQSECPLPRKLTIPYRAWQVEKIEPYAMRVAEELARDGMFRGLLGHGFQVFVRVERDQKRIVYSFRAADDEATDEVEHAAKRLR